MCAASIGSVYLIECFSLALAPREETEIIHPRDAAAALVDSDAAAAVASDPQRFVEIYERHYDRILNYLYRRTGNADTAADLASRTFLQALQWLQTRRVSGLQVKPWLYRIATTEHLQFERGQRRWFARIPLLGVSQSEAAPCAATIAGERQQQRRVYQALQTLPEKFRTPVILRYYEDMPFRDIAAVLQIAEASARSRVHRALEQLAKQLEEAT